MKFEEYYSPSSTLYEDVEEIVSMDNWEYDQINILILNIIIKYIWEYLGRAWREIEIIKQRVYSTLAPDTLNKGMDNLQSLVWVGLAMWDSFPLDCLCDIKQTAAIFREIALCTKFRDDDFFWLDMWSWTWILSLAAYISWKRKGLNKGLVVSIDQSGNAVEKWARVLSPLVWWYDFQGRVWDILDINTYKWLDMRKLSFWIGETIAVITPSFSIDTGDGELDFGDERENFFANIQKMVDPFPHLLSLHVREYPWIYEQIKNWDTAMFPNFIKKLYIPDGNDSTLTLTSSSHKWALKLYQVWKDFEQYEWFDVKEKRWRDSDDVKEGDIDGEIFSKIFGDLFPWNN